MANNETPPVDQIAVRLLRSSLRVVRSAGTLRAAAGTLRPPKLTALDTIVRNEGLTVDDLARTEGVREPTISVHLSGLREARMVEEFADLTDARVTKLRATRQGTERLEKDGRLYAGVLRRVKGRDLATVAAAVEVLERAFAAEVHEHRQREQRARERRTPSRVRALRTRATE